LLSANILAFSTNSKTVISPHFEKFTVRPITVKSPLSRQVTTCSVKYRGADKSLARPTSRRILMVRIFRLMLVLLYINSTNIPPILIINRIYEHQNLLSLYLVSFLVGLRSYQHPCTMEFCLYQLPAAKPGDKKPALIRVNLLSVCC
jgi:hypothetical protein